jgi:pentose-5-phosphate-3-epimerase
VVDVPAHGTGRAGPQLSVGILTADLTRLGEEVGILHGSGCWAHVDVIVSGRAIYDGTDPAGNLHRMLEQIRSVPAGGRLAAAAS